LWQSQSIDISGATELVLSFDLFSSSGLETTGAYQDFFRAFVVVDGNRSEIFTQTGGQANQTQSLTFSDLPEGDTLTLELEAKTTFRTENFTIDNIELSGLSAETTPEPSPEPPADPGPDGTLLDVQRALNIGNGLEAPSEGAWGYTIEEDHFAAIAAQGFDSVRIPIAWSNYTSGAPDFTIDPDWFDRVDEVIGWALAADLNVIINVHHFAALMNDPIGNEPKLQAIWEQVGEHYADQPDNVYFELINEPHNELSGDTLNGIIERLLPIVRESNPTRTVIIGGDDYSSIDGLLRLELPDDPYLAATFHFYEPFAFTHQDASFLGDRAPPPGFDWGSEADRQALADRIAEAKAWQADNGNIPVFVGEFGVNNDAPLDERVEWTLAVREELENAGFSWAHWDFAAEFDLYDETTDTWEPSLLAALVGPPPPEPEEPGTTLDLSATSAANIVDLEQGFRSEAARILPIGDSLTEGNQTDGGYRLPLWQSLTEELGIWVDYVGSSTENGAPQLLDSDHNGIGGVRANDVANNRIDGIIADNPHDIALVMLGTNDALASNPTSQTIDALRSIVTDLHAANPGVKILLATLPPSRVQTASDRLAEVSDGVRALVTELSGSIDISLVEFSGVDTANYYDNVHPDEVGSAAFADLWLAGLLEAADISAGTFDGTAIPVSGVSHVAGGTNNDRLMGDDAANTLDGAGGNDWLEGREGDDTLTGGSGNDVFVFDSSDAGADAVTDFEDGDQIRLTGFGYADASAAAADVNAAGADVVFTSGNVSVTFENAERESVLEAIEVNDISQVAAAAGHGGTPSQRQAPLLPEEEEAIEGSSTQPLDAKPDQIDEEPDTAAFAEDMGYFFG
ncbi:MAG: cellulase family glycosylhydrolase, partial [Pseudomonadota bacterium]